MASRSQGTRVKQITLEESLKLQREHNRTVEDENLRFAIERMKQSSARPSLTSRKRSENPDIADSLIQRMQNIVIETDSEDDDEFSDDENGDSDEAPEAAAEQAGVYTDEGFEEEA